MNENADPIDEYYDKAHGKPVQPAPLNEAEAWGTKQNPVRETPPAVTGVK